MHNILTKIIYNEYKCQMCEDLKVLLEEVDFSGIKLDFCQKFGRFWEEVVNVSYPKGEST